MGSSPERNERDGRHRTLHYSPEVVFIAVLLALLMLVFDRALISQFTLPKLLVLLISSSVLAAILAWRTWRGTLAVPSRIPLVCAGLLFAWWGLTTVTAMDPHTALWGYQGRFLGFWTHGAFLVVFLVFAMMPAERSFAVIRLLVPVAGAMSAYAFFQFLGLDPLDWQMMQHRAASTVGHPVLLASLLALFVPFALAGLFGSAPGDQRHGHGAGVGILLAGLMATGSRGPLLGLIVSLAVFFLLLNRSTGLRRLAGRQVLLGMAALAAGVVLAFGAFRSEDRRILSSAEIKSRLHFYQTAAGVIAAHPLTGVGLDCFALAYPRLAASEGRASLRDVIPTSVHNGYLQKVVAGGPVNLLLHLTLLGWVMISLVKRAPRSGEEATLRAALTASLAGFAVQDLTGWDDVAVTTFFWVILGASVSFLAPQPEGAREMKRSLRWPVAAGTVLCALAMLVPCSHALRWRSSEEAIVRLEGSQDPTDEDWVGLYSRALTEGGGEFLLLDRLGKAALVKMIGTRDVGWYERARTALDQALGASNGSSYVIMNRIDLELSAVRRGVREALDAQVEVLAEQLRTADPLNPTAWQTLAELRQAQGRHQEALVLVQKAREARPRLWNLAYLEGNILRSLQRFEPAANSYRLAVEILEAKGRGEGWVSASYGRVMSLSDAGRGTEALEAIDEVIEREPERSYSHYVKGVVLGKMGRSEEALRSFTLYEQKRPLDRWLAGPRAP